MILDSHQTDTSGYSTYTHAPELHPNLVIGTLQLLYWLLLHPSAWQNYVTRIDPKLPPDFTLLSLNENQWRLPTIRRLMIQSYLVGPMLSALLAFITLWILEPSNEYIAFGIVYGITLSLVSGILIGMVISYATSVAVVILIGISISIIGGVSPIMLAGQGSLIVFGNIDGSIVPLAVSFLILGVIGSVTANISERKDPAQRKQVYPLAKIIGGICLGILFGSILAISPGVITRFFITNNNNLFEEIFSLVNGITVCILLNFAMNWHTVRSQLQNFISILSFSAIIIPLRYGLYAMPYTMPSYIAIALFLGILFGTLLTSLIAPVYIIVRKAAGPWAGAIAGLIGGGGMYLVSAIPFSTIYDLRGNLFLGTASFLIFLITLGLSITWWQQPLLYPFQIAWNTILYKLDRRRGGEQPTLFRYHSAFWDEYQRIPLIGLMEYLVFISESKPAEGTQALAYLSTSHQRWAAQAAQVELDARLLERCTDIASIAQSHRLLKMGELGGSANALLRSFSRVSQDVEAASGWASNYNKRTSLNAVEERLDGLQRELTRGDEPYAVRFHPIVDSWHRIVAAYIDSLIETIKQQQELESPYVVGTPLTIQQELFVGRADISRRIEQLLLNGDPSPIFLYGQRRMGKTSMLCNLGRRLPSEIVPLFVDMEGVVPASTSAGFFYSMAVQMARSAQEQRGIILPPLTLDQLQDDPFIRFGAWLDQIEKILQDQTLLLALDEFETLDDVIRHGFFEEKMIMRMLRHLFQHRAGFKALLAASHTPHELQHLSGYLINTKVIHIGYLKEDEARQLIEKPVSDFALHYRPEASQRVLYLTNGHPFLIQLLCEQIVKVKNQQTVDTRREATIRDIELAIPEALSSGRFFFTNIVQEQVNPAGRVLLRFLAQQTQRTKIDRKMLATHCPDDLDSTLDLLIQRELVECTNGNYRFQVDLIRQWFAHL